MKNSLKEYFTSMGKWGWVVSVDIVGSLVGAYLSVFKAANVPTWLWLGFLALGIIVAPFLAFHKLRLQRDELKAKLQKKEDYVEVEIRGAVGTRGQGTITAVEFDLRVNNVPMQLAKVVLIMNNERFPCEDLPTDRIMDNVETHKVIFAISMEKILEHRKYDSGRMFWSGELCVLAGGKEWKSSEFEFGSAPIKRQDSDTEDSETQ